jgi:hypothetical protein
VAVHLDAPEPPDGELMDVQYHHVIPGVAREFAGHLHGGRDVARRKIAGHVHREGDGLAHGISLIRLSR